jgi:hypothetical protein
MNTLVLDAEVALAQSVVVTDDGIVVELSDGRTLTVPLAWYPRLQQGTPEERNNCRLIGHGDGVHWPDLDEDISVAGLVAGRPSGESQLSLAQWMKKRKRQASSVVPRRRRCSPRS